MQSSSEKSLTAFFKMLQKVRMVSLDSAVCFAAPKLVEPACNPYATLLPARCHRLVAGSATK
jgi:hypothetical protein